MVQLVVSWTLYAQVLSCYVSHQRIKIGEPVRIYLRVEIPHNAVLSFLPHQGVFPIQIREITQKNTDSAHFSSAYLELIDTFSIDSMRSASSHNLWMGHYTAVAWESGHVVVPVQHITIDEVLYSFNELTFTVIEPTVGKNGELFDIEEDRATIPDKVTFWQWLGNKWMWWLPILLVSIAITSWLFLRSKTHPQENANMSLKDRTLFAIDALDRQQLCKKGKLKQHYSELSYIVRAYLSSRFQLNLLECTTRQTYSVLKQTTIDPTIIDNIITVLKHTDVVKFANVLSEKYNEQYIVELVKEIVTATSPIDIEHTLVPKTNEQYAQ